MHYSIKEFNGELLLRMKIGSKMRFTMVRNVIIGLTGSFGSGCTTISNILKEKGFKIISISSFLKEEARKNGVEVSSLEKKEMRRVLQDIGNKKREKKRNVLIEECLENIDCQEDIVIESLKNPSEIYELKKYPNAYILATDTSFDVRTKRILKKEYDDDLAQFKKDDLREKDERIEWGQQVQKCVDLADILINNDEDCETSREWDSFKNKLGTYVYLMKNPGSRYPTDMELWMNNAYSISLKSACLKRQVGAVIVKEGYLIASGYNNVPKGEHPCKVEYNGKCYRDITRSKIKYCSICSSPLTEDFDCSKSECEYNSIKINKLLDKCRSLHAEENAILQAPLLGSLSLKNAVMYCTTFPCKLCANKIISVGIREVVYIEPYPDSDSIDFFKRHDKQVNVTKFEGVKAAAFYSLFKA